MEKLIEKYNKRIEDIIKEIEHMPFGNKWLALDTERRVLTSIIVDIARAFAKTSDENSNCNKPLISNLAKLKELVEQQQDIDPEIQKAVNKIYWDLI